MMGVTETAKGPETPKVARPPSAGASAETDSGVSQTRRTANGKRARTAPPRTSEIKASFLLPESALGKRVASDIDEDVSPAKRTRISTVTPTSNAREAARDSELAAALWTLHDLRGRLSSHPELLACLDERWTFYSNPSNLPAHLPAAVGSLPNTGRRRETVSMTPLRTPVTTKSKRERSPSLNGTPSAKRGTTVPRATVTEDDDEDDDGMDVDRAPTPPPAQPIFAPPGGFARFAKLPPQSVASHQPLQPQMTPSQPADAQAVPETPGPQPAKESKSPMSAIPRGTFATYASRRSTFTPTDAKVEDVFNTPEKPRVSVKSPSTGNSREEAIDIDHASEKSPRFEQVNLLGSPQPGPIYAMLDPDASERDPARAQRWMARGDRMLAKDNVAGAVDAYKKALDSDARADIAIKLARAYLAGGKQAAALLALASHITAASPVESIMKAATIYQSCFNFKRAIDFYEAVLAVEPSHKGAEKGMHECDRLKSIGIEASALLKDQKWQDVIEFLDRQLIATSPRPPQWQIMRVTAMLESRPVDFVAAQKALDELAISASSDAQACYVRARFGLLDEQDDQAQQYVRKALLFDSSHAETLALKSMLTVVKAAHTSFQDKSYFVAEQQYTRVIDDGLQTPALYVQRAVCRQMQRKWSGAIADCEAALAIRPDYYRALARLGLIKYQCGKSAGSSSKRYGEALLHLSEAAEFLKRARAAFEQTPLIRYLAGTRWLEELDRDLSAVLAEKQSIRLKQNMQEQQARASAAAEEAFSNRTRSPGGTGFFPRGAPGVNNNRSPGGGGARSAPREKHRHGPRPEPSPPKASSAYGGLAKHYETLRLPFGASKLDIQRAFRQLSKVHHPDRGGSATMQVALVDARDELLKALGD